MQNWNKDFAVESFFPVLEVMDKIKLSQVEAGDVSCH